MERMKETEQTEVVVAETTKTEVNLGTKMREETKKREVMMGLEFDSGISLGSSFSLDLKAHLLSFSFSFPLAFSVS